MLCWFSRLEYYDDSSCDLGSPVDDLPNLPEPSEFSVKNIRVSKGLSLYTDVFHPCHRSASSQVTPDQSVNAEIFVSISQLPNALSLLLITSNFLVYHTTV